MGTNKRQIGDASRALVLAVQSYMGLRDIRANGLAEKSGVPLSTLRKILQHRSVMDFEQLQKISLALGVEPSTLVAKAEQILKDGELNLAEE